MKKKKFPYFTCFTFILINFAFQIFRHVGDLGNIIADKDGTANIDITDSRLNLSGPHSIMKRAIVVRKNVII